MFRTTGLSLLLFSMALPSIANTWTCESADITVTATSNSLAAKVCKAVEQTQAVLSQCELPEIKGPLRIEIVEDLPPGCVALYHCQEKWIEVLSPVAMDARWKSDGAFGFLDLDTYFRSVVVHELTHVIFDDVPCPFEACVAANEYVAYALQVMSLSPDQQRAFEDRAGLDRKISSDELNAMFLFMAPNKFAQKAWTHLSQREDSCTFIRQITDGTILFDRGHF